MQKKPVGYFEDPQSKELVVVLARNSESPAAARERVALKHNVDVAIISENPPPGVGNPGLIVDIPDKRIEAQSRKRKDAGESAAQAVHRYDSRLSGPPKAQQAPAIEKLLGASGGNGDGSAE